MKHNLQSLTVIIVMVALLATCSLPEPQRLTTLPTPTANAPANPNASANARKVLDYFYRLKNSTSNVNRILIGQFAGFADWEFVQQDYNRSISDLYTATGKYPGLMVTSYGYWSEEIDYHVALNRINPIIKDYWNMGGLIGIMPHYRNPLNDSLPWGEGDEVVTTNYPLNKILEEGSIPNQIMKNEMDRVAWGLQDLENAGVVILWRPFHEMNGGWYWQGKHEKDYFIALWRYEFDYLTRVKGLSNLLYVYGPNYQEPWMTEPERDTTYYYPGDDYVDLIGLSIYDVDPSKLNTNGGWDAVRLINKPRGIYEFGPPNKGNYDYNSLMNVLKNNYSDIVFISSWFPDSYSWIENPNPSIVMNDPWIITRDEVVLDVVATPTQTATKTP